MNLSHYTMTSPSQHTSPKHKKTIIQRRRIKNVVVLPTEALDQFWTLPYRRKKIATQSYKSKSIPLSHHIALAKIGHLPYNTSRQPHIAKWKPNANLSQAKLVCPSNQIHIYIRCSHMPHWKPTVRGGPWSSTKSIDIIIKGAKYDLILWLWPWYGVGRYLHQP